MRIKILCLAIALLPINVAMAKEEALVYGAQFEELEYRKSGNQERLLTWDSDAFVGNDNLKLRWISEGEYDLRANSFTAIENRMVAQKPVSEFFDLKAGVRLDYYGNGSDGWYAVLGATGLAPQWFEVDADLFVNEQGDASVRLDTEYELLLSNYLFLIASAESTYAFATDNKAGVGSGVNDLEAGLRLSYDLVDRSVAPYIGVVYEKKYGNTAAIAREEGEAEEEWFFVIGVKLML